MSTTHPQVGAYLDDLARMLADIDPGERDDILASVREHLDAEIGAGDGSDAVVHAALLRLGPPEQVAAEARAGQQGLAAPPHLTATPDASGAAHPRHPLRTRVAAMVCLATVGVPALLALSWLAPTLTTEGAAGWPDSVALLPHAVEALVLMVALFPVWLVTLVILLVTREISTFTKWFLAALGPATSIVMLVAARVEPTSTIADLGIGGLVCIGGLAVVLVWNVVTGRRVWRETRP